MAALGALLSESQRELKVAILDWKHGSSIEPSRLFRGHMSLTLFHIKHFIFRTQWPERFLIPISVKKKKKRVNRSPAPTPAALLGTYKIRHLCNKTLSALSFWSLHSSHFSKALHRRANALLGKTWTPCRANTKGKVILTKLCESVFSSVHVLGASLLAGQESLEPVA